LETRGECIFICQTGWADCDGLAWDGGSKFGCEADVSTMATCDDSCVNCNVLSGIDRTQPHNCIPDVSGGLGQYRCQFSCITGGGANCADRDLEWQNGCERAQNGDVDAVGLFVNQGDFMDCSVMEEEAIVNPELFRHHLHIDLTVPVLTTVETLPAGSIFCNNELVAATGTNIVYGRCYFVCIPGFYNGNGLSYDGCEARHPIVTQPYRFVFPSVASTIPLRYGGYMIGDYEVEYYMAWLTHIAPALPLTLPYNTGGFNYQLSLLYVDYRDWSTVDWTTQRDQVLWY
jgi:hypothetical protein